MTPIAQTIHISCFIVGRQLTKNFRLRHLLTDLVTDMADIDQTASLDAGVKRLPAQRITFDSESSRQRVTILALTLIPGVLLLTMAVVLLKRRRL